MTFWENKKVVVTGGDGFLGRKVVDGLNHRGVIPYVVQYDLRETANVGRMYFENRPDVVIHLAATVGGIGKNIKQPGKMFYDNLKMGMDVIEIGKRYPAKIVIMGSACEYPKNASIPLQEDFVFDGPPEGTNGAYGIAKRALLTMGQAYRQQYGMNIIHLLSTNLYGPGDNFGEGSHFIPAAIRRCIEARDTRKDSLTLWGTGNATRDFLYVKDAAEGILLAAEHYNGVQPVNLGSGCEQSIHDVAERINLLTGCNAELLWDTRMPDGQPRRVLDTSRAKSLFGFEAKTSFEDGLRETITWYQEKSRLVR